MLIADFYSEEDSSFLRMTGWRGVFNIDTQPAHSPGNKGAIYLQFKLNASINYKTI
ncbi:hypothetical protein GCM10022210_14790 [Mucilaginibacter dorajii]|uniref:Uncharacterized protein n=1 Tax=Mucilaginibacter dorajii TaxID=692994 RepID=A0ABP7PKN3_9SPHI